MGKYKDLDENKMKYAYQCLDCYYRNLNQDQSESMLANKPIGSFLVCDSSITKSNDRKYRGTYLVISKKESDNQISHTLICMKLGDNILDYTAKLHPQATFVEAIGNHLERNYDIQKAIVRECPDKQDKAARTIQSWYRRTSAENKVLAMIDNKDSTLAQNIRQRKFLNK